MGEQILGMLLEVSFMAIISKLLILIPIQKETNQSIIKLIKQQ